MRMYGREKIDVVKPTNAVSATRKTLNGSTKNCLSSTRSGPSRITRAVNAAAARNVSRLTMALISGARWRWPMRASTMPPRTGKPRTAMISIIVPKPRRPSRDVPCGPGLRPRFSLALLQLLHVLQIEAVELLANLEEEDAEDQHADQHVQRDA